MPPIKAASASAAATAAAGAATAATPVTLRNDTAPEAREIELVTDKNRGLSISYVSVSASL